MIPLLIPHPTLSALYKAIVANPQADDPRLQFADACEELDDPHPSIPAWGKFIKAQYALKAMGSPRYELQGVIQRSGPDYFRIHGDDDAPIKPGDRVDVSGVSVPESGKSNTVNAGANYPGLVVVKITPTDSYGTTEIVLKKDAESIPFPQKEYDRLKDDCRYLFSNYGTDWIERYGKRSAKFTPNTFEVRWTVVPEMRGSYPEYRLWLSRGFVSVFDGWWDMWLKNAKHILPRFPITKVDLKDTPLYSGRAHVEKCGTFWFTPKGPRVTDLMVSLDAMEPDAARDRICRALLAKHWPSVSEWELPPVAPTRSFGYDTSDPADPH